jgi:hypothetical protein
MGFMEAFLKGITFDKVMNFGVPTALLAAIVVFVWKYGPGVIQAGKELAVSLNKLATAIDNQGATTKEKIEQVMGFIDDKETATKEKLNQVMLNCNNVESERFREFQELKELAINTLRTVEKIDNQFPVVNEIKLNVNNILLAMQRVETKLQQRGG